MNQEHHDKLLEGSDAWNKWREENPDIRPDLQKADLSMTDLQKANLQRADLEEANLRYANFRGANLQKAALGRADLRNAYLGGANLQHANIWRADLRDANLVGADVKNANLWRADLQNANLVGADFSNTFVGGIKYNRKGNYIGIRVAGCYGDPGFRRFAQDQEYIEMIRQSRPVLYRLWLISSDCGRSIGLWCLWSLVLAVYFGISFFLLGSEHFTVKEPMPFDLMTMIYYSAVTFTTLGFGDIVPKTHTGAFWVAAEVVIGYIMLGGLISIFTTKFARRA
ncbi:pentapeptide repeat-containing protein [Thermodesulfobacteriota bacterium]